MKLILVPLHGGPTISLDKAILFFGRGSECDVVLTDSRKVSRKHCCVAQIDDRIMVRDLGSMNGIRLNETDVNAESQMHVGDVLWVGDLGFRLESAGNSNRKPNPAGHKKSPESAPKSPAPDLQFLSQDFPVAIPEQDAEFQIEQTGPQSEIPADEIIDLNDSDVLEDEI